MFPALVNRRLTETIIQIQLKVVINFVFYMMKTEINAGN